MIWGVAATARILTLMLELELHLNLLLCDNCLLKDIAGILLIKNPLSFLLYLTNFVYDQQNIILKSNKNYAIYRLLQIIGS